MTAVRILISGFGNVLRCDDAFGVEVARRLEQVTLPAGVRVVETGIAGLTLVQELRDGFDALVVVDAVDHGRLPGTVLMIEPEVLDVDTLSWDQRHELLTDMHLTTPERAFVMARALGVLPENRLLVGCQISDPEAVGEEMTPEVAAAVDVAVAEIVRHVNALTASMPA